MAGSEEDKAKKEDTSERATTKPCRTCGNCSCEHCKAAAKQAAHDHKAAEVARQLSSTPEKEEKRQQEQNQEPLKLGKQTSAEAEPTRPKNTQPVDPEKKPKEEAKTGNQSLKPADGQQQSENSADAKQKPRTSEETASKPQQSQQPGEQQTQQAAKETNQSPKGPDEQQTGREQASKQSAKQPSGHQQPQRASKQAESISVKKDPLKCKRCPLHCDVEHFPTDEELEDEAIERDESSRSRSLTRSHGEASNSRSGSAREDSGEDSDDESEEPSDGREESGRSVTGSLPFRASGSRGRRGGASKETIGRRRLPTSSEQRSATRRRGRRSRSRSRRRQY